MPVDELDTIIGSVNFEKKEIEWIWEKQHGAFEVH